jgi:serine/threonine protein kinase
MIEPGHRVDEYEIQRRLGHGGMGPVYLANDTALGRLVAIKLIADDLDVPDARERFIREACTTAGSTIPTSSSSTSSASSRRNCTSSWSTWSGGGTTLSV